MVYEGYRGNLHRLEISHGIRNIEENLYSTEKQNVQRKQKHFILEIILEVKILSAELEQSLEDSNGEIHGRSTRDRLID